MENVLLFILAFACIPTLFFICFQLFNRLLEGFSREDFPEVLESKIEPVSILISCYNEGRYIREKIQSLLRVDEWIEGSELLVISTGSTDNTDQVLAEFHTDSRVRVFSSADRKSKIEAINSLVEKAQHEILVFSDCRQRMKTGSIRELVSRFSDSSIGTVSATLEDTKLGTKPSFFRSMYNFFALRSSKKGSCMNVYGALYAQRKSVYRVIPDNIIFDDLFVVVSTLNQGLRLVQEEKAVIYDLHFAQYYQAERIERLVRGLLLFLFNHFKLIQSLPWKLRRQFYRYKYFKLFIPFLVLALVITGGIFSYFMPIFGYWFISVILALSLLQFYPKIRKITLFLVRLNWFIAAATIKFLFFNKRDKTWEKLPKLSESPSALL